MNMDVLRSKILNDLKNLSMNQALLGIIKECDDDETVNCKTLQNSEKLRDRGSKLLAKGDLDNKQLHKVLSLYNESIARAPIGSEGMAKTYASKSALLFDMRKYKECITEADKALKITNLIFLKVKLLCRKAECLTALGSSENRSYLEKAKFILNKSEDVPMIKKMLEKFIEDTQLVINEGKLDKPRENKRIAEVSKIVADEEGKDIWKSVAIKYNEKYGRHAVAARDFDPGDIIFVEKPYMYHVGEATSYQYCYKCFNYLWTAVPCDQCCWRMFCSEKCKSEAWDEYHDLECSVMSKLRFALCCQWCEVISALLSIFFKAFKDAGSIDQLITDFKSSLTCGDQCDGDLNYKTILASITFDVRREDMKFLLHNTGLTLVGLAKFTTIFGRSYNFSETEKLMRNEKAIDVGCLLLKLNAAMGTNCVTVKLVDTTVRDGSFAEGQNDVKTGNTPDWTSLVFSVMTMQALRGCIPNVDTTRTFGHRTIMYAIAPIKAGTPLTLFNNSPSVYDDNPKDERQLKHQALYKCRCDCRACTENWPENFQQAIEDLRHHIINNENVMKFGEEYSSIMNEWDANVKAHKPSYPDLKVMTRANNCAKEGWRLSSISLAIMKLCTVMLVGITNTFHNPDKNLFTTS